MRFFFNIIEGANYIRDEEGTDLPGEQAAQEEARIVAAELRREFPERFLTKSVLEVYSEVGRCIMALPICLPHSYERNVQNH